MLPHRQSLAYARRLFAGAGLGCAVLPPLYAVLFGLAWVLSA
ncbi:hypothetical protein [Streptomyces sp. NPDC018693]